MAEFFTPSTTGEGQGAAQIFQSNPQFADASGIVRGIERAEARIAANQEKEYERQKEESKERRDKINKLQELQYGGGSEFLRSVSDDIMNDFRKAVVDNGEDIDEAYSKARVGFERVKNAGEATTKVAGLVNADVDNYRTFVNGKWETGSLTPLEIAKSKHDGDWEESLGNFENELTNFGSSPTNMIDAGVNLEKTYLEDKKAAEADKETKQTLLDNGDIKTSETITPKNKKERRDFLLNSPQIQRSVLNETKLQYGVSTIEELEKAIGMPFPQYFKQRVDELFDKEDVVNIKEELPKKEGGGKGITKQDLTIAKQVKEAVNILQDNPSSKESREGLNTFLAPYNLIVKSYGDSTPIEIKDLGLSDGDIIFVDNDGKAKSAPLKANDADGIYRVIAKAAPDVKLEALGQIEFKDPTTQATSTPKELKDDITLLMEGDDNVLSKFEGVEVDRNTASPDILKVDDKTFDITNPKTAKEAFEYLEKRGYKKETTTREDLNAREAERRNTEEETERPEPRKPTLTDAEVKAMYGKKVSKEVFKQMTVKQRAKFAQNAGTWEDE